MDAGVLSGLRIEGRGTVGIISMVQGIAVEDSG